MGTMALKAIFTNQKGQTFRIFKTILHMTIHQVTMKENVWAYSAIEEPKWSRARGANVAIVYDRKPTNECFCCEEHELITGKLDELDCITTKSGLDQYVVHRPSLEMAFIDAMIKKHLRKTVPQQLTNTCTVARRRGGGRSGFQSGTRVVHGSDHFYQCGDVSDMLKWREDGGLQIVY